MSTVAKFTILLWISFFYNCTPVESQNSYVLSNESKNYWFDGKAEITSYTLLQSRYGQAREGEAVLVFVSEDFRKDKQVKYEGGDRKNVVPVLKLNKTKKFLTGIYPYSIMTSCFTPIDGSQSIKTTTSIQEWCGHTFTQLNRDKKGYKGKMFSYFQNEGDEEFTVKCDLIEDEIWAKLRLNPNNLTEGEYIILPGSEFLRLKHLPSLPSPAQVNINNVTNENEGESNLKEYTISYKDVDRKLIISLESEFPYAIVKWVETDAKGSPMNTTIATKKASIKSPYWSKNRNSDRELRKELGLK